MIRVDAGNRLLKKEKSGYSHKGNNHLFLYYSCSYTLILLHHFFSHASIAILHDVQALGWSSQALAISRIARDFLGIRSHNRISNTCINFCNYNMLGYLRRSLPMFIPILECCYVSFSYSFAIKIKLTIFLFTSTTLLS